MSKEKERNIEKRDEWIKMAGEGGNKKKEIKSNRDGKKEKLSKERRKIKDEWEDHILSSTTLSTLI